MIGSFCFYISNKHFNLTIMKKIFLSLAFLFGIGMSVMADNTMQIKNDTIAVEDGFKTIDLKEVPQSIKDAIAKKAPGSTLKSASLSQKQEGIKSYRAGIKLWEQSAWHDPCREYERTVGKTVSETVDGAKTFSAVHFSGKRDQREEKNAGL